MLYTPKEELERRISNFQDLLVENGIDGALIIQAADLYYFSGTAQNANLYIPSQGQPVLMVRKSYTRAKEESPLDSVIPLPGIKKIPEVISGEGYRLNKIGLELDVLPASTYLFYAKVFSNSNLADISPLVRKVRQVKSEYELELLRNSGRKMNEVFQQIPEKIRPGISEIELASEIEKLFRSKGHLGYIGMRAFALAPFMGHLMSGWTAAIPSAFDGPTGGGGLNPSFPQGPGIKELNTGEPILADYGGNWNGYIIDQTRIFSLGKLPDKLVNAYKTAVEIQDAVVEKIKPGVSGSDLHQLALDMAEEAGLSENFMGFGNDQARFIGHGVGLELDELPVLAKGVNTALEPGMVFAIEPKFIFPGEGVVGIENTYALLETGAEKLTLTADEIIIIDA